MPTICLAATTLYYPEGGGHMWVYLNWALGFLKNGCKVIWLEEVKPAIAPEKNHEYICNLKERLKIYNLQDAVALWQSDGLPLNDTDPYGCINVETAASQADILLNQDYVMPYPIVALFKRTALLDVDPGLLQLWIHQKAIHVVPHDYYFTIGETIDSKNSLIPDVGIDWIYTPPCVSLDHWPVKETPDRSSFTTVTHWSGNGWEEDNGEIYDNSKQVGFLPFISLPQYSTIQLELAILLGENEQKEQQSLLEKNGWLVKDSPVVAGSPAAYQKYIQRSAGEFSCVKPSCIRMQNGWISDRSLCYLSSGKPVVVQNTGPSRFLPDNAGLLRFQDLKGAIKCLEEVATNYDRHCTLARALAEEYFDAKKVTKSLLERAL